ncbi:hypothetical protein BO94DRAFT_589868 [Aspergillus sclerotioniger CBS 115572]|uniref:Rhodopsin domain-containing protein n=1 Tax=Aspergillus sclerotioniger CBS 115572 TaxID=1450535 RepID=A0A317VBR3_9EURO|nr:hypothetical protein BO94DRAFT_589868 [Aspergillus sclerotioniger CBS 115572]PWY71794.1 hypothetical protein BO94DRAFT_589868 [Aspergillus sclerotioniger CBS 115572]
MCVTLTNPCQMLYAEKLLGITCITCIKLSLLAFFHTLFSVSDTFRWCNWGMVILCIAWWLVFMIVNIFMCRPIHMMWDSIVSTEYCIARGRLCLSMGVSNIILDVMILCLPLSMLKALPLTFGQKCQVAGIFLLGRLVWIASMVQFAYIWDPTDPQYVRAPETCL